MIATDSHVSALSDEHRQQLESWLVEFQDTWDEKRLATWARQLPLASTPLRRVALVEMVKVDLERQWQRGQPARLESYLKGYPELGTPDSVSAELVQAEYLARQQFGGTAELADFSRRFPRQAAQLRQLLNPSPPKSDTVKPSQPRPSTITPTPSTMCPAPPSSPTPLPEHFGRYHILKQLGRGGMGTVYLAHDTQLDRSVALKVPQFGPDASDEVRERFFREARAAATLSHANLCPVYDVGEVEGVLYLTMPYLLGRTLSQFIDGGKPLPQRAVASVVRKLALALAEAHAKGIIHRDLKPANIMISPRHEPIIMDFGLARQVRRHDARLTQSGLILGTPAYMPPEQVKGDVDAMGTGCDVYSLGVILYEMLTGILPFGGPPAAMLALILAQPPEPPSRHRPDLDAELEAVCLKALSKNAEDRFANMTAFAAVLTEYLRKENPTVSAAAPAPAESPSALAAQWFDDGTSPPGTKVAAKSSLAADTVPRHRGLPWFGAALGGLAVVVLLGSVVMFIRSRGQVTPVERSETVAVAAVPSEAEPKAAPPKIEQIGTATAEQPPTPLRKSEPPPHADTPVSPSPADAPPPQNALPEPVQKQDSTPAVTGFTLRVRVKTASAKNASGKGRLFVGLNNDGQSLRFGDVGFSKGEMSVFDLPCDLPIAQVRSISLVYPGKDAWKCESVTFQFIQNGRTVAERSFPVNAWFSSEPKDQKRSGARRVRSFDLLRN